MSSLQRLNVSEGQVSAEKVSAHRANRAIKTMNLFIVGVKIIGLLIANKHKIT